MGSAFDFRPMALVRSEIGFAGPGFRTSNNLPVIPFMFPSGRGRIIFRAIAAQLARHRGAQPSTDREDTDASKGVERDGMGGCVAAADRGSTGCGWLGTGRDNLPRHRRNYRRQAPRVLQSGQRARADPPDCPCPFKRPYIWDLMSEVSGVRRCIAKSLRVYLLDLLRPTKNEDGFDLAEYANALPSAAIDAIGADTALRAPVLVGHSLGGTLPSQLFEEVIEQLYRKDGFVAGTLQIGNEQTGVGRLRAQVMAVVNPVGHIVPPGSVLKGLEAAPDILTNVLHYEGDHGSMLQHLGPLVAPVAHKWLWPKILDWTADLSARRS